MFSISPAAYSALKYASLTFGLAGIIFILGIFLGNLFGNITRRIVKRINLNGNLKKTLGIDLNHGIYHPNEIFAYYYSKMLLGKNSYNYIIGDFMNNKFKIDFQK